MKLHSEWVNAKKTKGHARIRYWEDGKNKVLSKELHPKFLSKEEADLWCAQKNAQNEQARLLSRDKSLIDIEFKKQLIGDWTTIIDEYIEWHKASAIYTHECARSWLKIYILPFYLEKKVRFHQWPEYFDEFRDFLLTKESGKSKKKLAYSSRNHIIKYLNSFLLFVKEKKKLIGPFEKCKQFPNRLLNQRGVEAVFTFREIEMMKQNLENPAVKFCYILLNTGMRLNELFSLQAVNIEDDTERAPKSIMNHLKSLGKTIYGFIVLESQMENSSKKNYRDENGHIKRKPLKCRDSISSENDRIIPITDKLTWDILVVLQQSSYNDYAARKYLSSNVDDYLLFNNLTYQEIIDEIRIFFSGQKSSHCSRHTFTTNLVQEFLEANIGPENVRHITGHGEEEWRRYSHIVLDKNKLERKKSFRPLKLASAIN